MPNLDIIYDVTTEVTCDERKTNKQVIYQTTSLPSFVTFQGRSQEETTTEANTHAFIVRAKNVYP